MRRLVGLLAAALVASVGHAEATMINFEDIAQAHGTETVVYAPNFVVSDGFKFDAENHSHVNNAVWGTDNGTTTLVLDDFLGPDATTVSQVGGAPFALNSIDISEANAAFFSARQIQVTGNLFGGGTVSTVLFLDNNLVDGVTANYFQTFTFNAGWDNLTSFVLNGAGALAGGGNYYAIDNVNVGAAEASVPEPATLSLVGLGSAYMVRRRRNRR